MKKKNIIISIIIIIAVVLVIFLGAGYYFFRVALTPIVTEITDSNYIALNKANQEALVYLNKLSYDKFAITGYDGNLKIGKLYRNDSHKYIILVHGYTSNMDDVSVYAKKFHQVGYNVLTPDLTASGSSGGKYIQMGYNDRIDIVRWINLILREDKEAKIALYGISMGAATVMMTSGETLPTNVKAIIEDSGYTSVWDIFSHQMGVQYNLPIHPLLDIVSMYSKLFAGYNFKEASSLNQIKKNITPMLFIHGEQDKFVPFSMEKILYDECKAPKEIIGIPDSTHAMSELRHPELFWPVVIGFLDKYVGE